MHHRSHDQGVCIQGWADTPSSGRYASYWNAFLFEGMLPHKQYRGKAALDRMKCFEGMPAPYDKKKRMVIPAALKVLRMNLVVE